MKYLLFKLSNLIFQLEYQTRKLHLGSALRLQKLNSQLISSKTQNPCDGEHIFLVSMCTYNGEKWVCEAIQGLLEQSYLNWHLFITDDGSKDDTPKLLRDFKSSYPDRITLNLLNNNCSPFTPTNFSIRFFLNHSEYSAFTILDQDDVPTPTWLDKCNLILPEHNGVFRCKNARYDESLQHLKYTYPAASQIVATRNVIMRIGERVDRNHPIPSDTEYLKRLEKDAVRHQYPVILTPFLCQKMRLHGTNQSILGTIKPVN